MAEAEVPKIPEDKNKNKSLEVVMPVVRKSENASSPALFVVETRTKLRSCEAIMTLNVRIC